MDIQLVAFDIPYPPTYGGVIDVYYKLKFLAEVGVGVHLHCFFDDRSPAPQLNSLCKSVQYYRRKPALQSLPWRFPYMAYSRRSHSLLARLLQADQPVLFEGLHTTFCLPDLARVTQQPLAVRLHNIEHDYYEGLAQAEPNPLKRLYFSHEAQLLKSFEQRLANADMLLPISQAEDNYFGRQYGRGKTHYLPAFHPHERVCSIVGKGKFILYHGNLAVAENHQAAMELTEKVFAQLPYPCIIAGANPKPLLQKTISRYPHCQLVANPDEATLLELLQNAHIHLLTTQQPTGIKLKLLNALFLGRHLIANEAMVAQTGMETLCYVADQAETWVQLIHQLMQVAFGEGDIAKRQEVLLPAFCNRQNALRLAALLKA